MNNERKNVGYHHSTIAPFSFCHIIYSSEKPAEKETEFNERITLI